MFDTIEKLERATPTPPPTYTMHEAAPFEKIPRLTLKMVNKDIPFSADSAATLSVIRASHCTDYIQTNVMNP